MVARIYVLDGRRYEDCSLSAQQNELSSRRYDKIYAGRAPPVLSLLGSPSIFCL